MKFLCPQCKAKYRIADEKLAQRASSRMKCRKCGHVIDIHSASVPESLRPPGVAADSDDDDEDQDRGSEERPIAEPGRPTPGAGGAPPARRGTSPAAKGPAPKRTAPAPKRPAAVPPRRGAAAVAEAVAEKAPASEDEPVPTARVSARPEPPKVAPPKVDAEEEPPTRIHDGMALAAAFSQAVDHPSSAPLSPAPSDEWYVGIEGTPTGPMGLPELRDRALQRKVTLDSLVWRDGFEEWKPLSSFPELVTLVEEALRGASEPFDPRTIPAPSPLEEAQARAAAGAVPVPSEVPSDLLDKIGVKSSKQTSHPAAWVAVFVALAFGVTVGAVFLSKTEQHEVVKYVQVESSAKPAPGPVGGDPKTIEESTVSGGGTKRTSGVASKAEPGPTPVASKGLPTLGGLGSLGNLGPAPQGPDVSSPGNAPGGQLDGNSIQRVVANFSSSVRRGCWDTALSARAPDAPSSARVGVTITIGASGSVEDVTTTGDPRGYPALAHCIESKVRGWRFPRSSGTTTAQVPFVFAAQ